MWSLARICVAVFAAALLQSTMAQEIEGDEPKAQHEPAVKLTVLEPVSGEPVRNAEVWFRPHGSGAWIAAGKATNGIMSIDTAKYGETEIELMIKTGDGAAARTTRSRSATWGEVSITMPQNPTISARLVAPFPELAATLLVGPERAPSLFRECDSLRANDTCDAAGVFIIERDPDVSAVIVDHDLGYACIPIAGCFDGMEVTLQPWRTLRGQLLKNGKPAPHETVSAASAAFPCARLPLAGESFTVETDVNGRFAFDQMLPAGDVSLVAFGQIQRTFPVKMGKPTEVVFDCTGKEIEGALSYTGPEEIDWNVARAMLLACRGAREAVALDNVADDTDEEESYAVEIGPEGTFSGKLIPAGEYFMIVMCSVIGSRNEEQQGSQLLTFSGNIEVSPGTGQEKFHVMLTKEESTIDEPQ